MGAVNSISKKLIKKYMGAILIISVILVIFTEIIIVTSNLKQKDIRQLRIELADIVSSAENGDYSELSNFDAAVFDTCSNVLYSNIDDYKVGDKANLHLLSCDDKSNMFITPIVKDNKQIGNLLINIKKEKSFDMSKWYLILIPIIILCIIIIYSINVRKYIKCDIINPVNDVNAIAKELIKGNYEIKLKYDSKNEVGKLCHNIEFLRDELHSSSIREEKLYKKEKMILTCISHDLKTPVAIISGFAQGIRDGIASDKNQIIQYSKGIISKADLLTKLINDILENASVEDNNTSINKTEILLPQYMEDVLSTLMPYIEKNNIDLCVGKIPDVLVNIDCEKIYRVFQNIIGNSIKYIDKDGEINIDFMQQKNKIMITILDNGKGINAMDIPFVFDKFYRGEAARNQNIGGSGLGLSIVKNIIELHGGRVECDSVVGEGTAISFSLPLA